MLSHTNPSDVIVPSFSDESIGIRVAAMTRSIAHRLFLPVDIASIVTFRVTFGALMIWELYRYHSQGWIQYIFIEPSFTFPYVGFEWVRPWPGDGMYYHFLALGALAFMIAIGLFYRVSMTLFFLGFTYVFLVEKSNYLNHFYLICLISFLMIFVPANRAFSCDALARPSTRSNTVPTWTLWLLRAQLAIVYVFGGVAKLNEDWLRGEPMRTWLADQPQFPVIGRWFREEWMVYLFSYGGLLFDFLFAPLILWRRTRIFAVVVAILFHLLNAKLFNIGIFPWLMLATTVLLLPPDLARRVASWVLRRFPSRASALAMEIGRPTAPARRLTRRQRLISGALATYLLFQIVVPLRHLAYAGNVNWTDEGDRFSWRMMLVSKFGGVWFYATDPTTGEVVEIDPYRYLTSTQVMEMSIRPDMILQFSHFLADELTAQGYRQVEVRVRTDVSLNGRPFQYLIDPGIDLTTVDHSISPATWIVPLETE